MNKKVSIIVPMYNCSLYIDKCICSLINQTYKNLEIILVNDGSTDNSLEKIEEYQKQDNRIKVITQNNKGVSSARNTGIKNSTGEYIAFVDSDDYLDDNVIELLVTNIENDTLLRINYKKITTNDELIVKTSKKEYSIDEYILGILTSKIGGFCWGYLFEKCKIEYFDENTSYLEDALFLINYLNKISKIKTIDNTYYNYQFNQNSITKTNCRIIKNIIDFDYSLNKLKNIIKIKGISNVFNKKKIKLIESELAKLDKTNIKEVLNNKEIIKIIKSLYKEKITILEKIYFSIILNKRYFLFNIYLYIRKVLKKIKNR